MKRKTFLKNQTISDQPHSSMDCRSSRPQVFCKKGVLRNFAKCTGKHLCQSLFFLIKLQVYLQRKTYMKNQTISDQHHGSMDFAEVVVHKFSVRKGVLRNFAKFTGKHLCQSLFLNKVTGLRHCEISRNTFSYRTPLVAVSKTCA